MTGWNSWARVRLWIWQNLSEAQNSKLLFNDLKKNVFVNERNNYVLILYSENSKKWGLPSLSCPAPQPKGKLYTSVSYMLSHNYLIFLIHSFEVTLINKLLFIHTQVKIINNTVKCHQFKCFMLTITNINATAKITGWWLFWVGPNQTKSFQVFAQVQMLAKWNQ